jgi:hypothetical protein
MVDQQQNDDTRVNQFRVLVIEKTEPPENATAGEWYRYVIGHEATSINGMRSGSLRSVTLHLEEYVEKLNSRTYWGYSHYATRKGR